MSLKDAFQKQKKLALKHEYYLDWLQATYWEKEMLVSQSESKQRFEKIEKLIKEEQDIKYNSDEEVNYFNLRISVDALLLKDIKLTSPEKKKKFNQIISSKLLSGQAKPVSKKSKINYYHLKARVAQLRNNQEEAFKMAKNLVAVFEDNPHFHREHIDWYKKSICMFSGICIFSGQIEEIPRLIKIIGNDDEHLKIVCLHGLRYSMIKMDKESGMSYLKKIKAMIEKQNHNIRAGRQLTIFYNAAVFFIIFNEWVEMNVWLEKIMKFKRTDDRRDLQYGARILTLINHFELKSDDMDNQIQAVSHYFTNNKQYNDTNKYIIQAFRYLYRAINRREMMPIWINLQNYLNTKVDENKEATLQLGLRELYIWCTSKIKNISFSEVYRNS